jgi:ABC-2 type transport system ATP-binding protein
MESRSPCDHGPGHTRRGRAARTAIAPTVTENVRHPVEIEGLRVYPAGRAVLDDITLTVRVGEIFGLLGLRGAGKTSLLGAILMLIEPAAGTVRLFGEAHDRPGARSRLAYLPERFQPPGHLSGYEFVRLTLALHGSRMRRARIAAMAEELELDPSALARPIRSYAKGTAQKLGLLAMLATDLPLLLLDEPMSGLDPRARILVKRHLAAYRGRGRTILLASSMPADHERLCDRIAILHCGRLIDVGASEELQARFAAPTLGSALLAAVEQVCRLRAPAS